MQLIAPRQIAAVARIPEGELGVCCIAGGGKWERNSVLFLFSSV